MQSIKYRITALLPLLFSSNTGDPNMIATFDYIPGTYLRGMFANEYIRKKGITAKAHKDEKFYRWFLKGEIKITNAYISSNKYQFLPLPHSIQKEKGTKSTFYDLLFQAQEFDKQTTAVTGYVDENITYKKTVKKVFNFHHARDRERGVSKEGQIFNYESIDKNQVFEGFIIGDLDSLKEFSSIISNGIYYIGKSRNNQYGKIKFEILETNEFNPKINIEEEDAVLTLLSDAIIYNENGYSTTDITYMEKELDCKIKKAFIKQSEQEGFMSVWKLKTPSEICFKAGSVFLLEKGSINKEKLKELEITGIGERTHEGFGRFIIDWQNRSEKFNIVKEEETKSQKPDSKPPKIVETLIQNIVKEYVKNQVEISAIEKVSGFEKPFPSKSLLAKLEGAIKTGSFENLMSEPKDKVRFQLEKCKNDSTDLYTFINSYKIDDGRSNTDNKNIIKKDIDNIVTRVENKIKTIYKEIPFSLDSQDFKSELKKTYLITFLSIMRKKIKQAGGNDAKK